MRARPLYSLAVHDPGFFAPADPRFVRYVAVDSRRVAEAEDIPFRFPRPDPIEQSWQMLRIAPEQLRIRRLMRLDDAIARATPQRGDRPCANP